MFGVRVALPLLALTLGSHLAFAQTRVKAETFSIALPNAWKTSVYKDTISASTGSGRATSRIEIARFPTQSNPTAFFNQRWDRNFNGWRIESDSALTDDVQDNIRILTRGARMSLNATQFVSYLYLYTADWTFTTEVISTDFPFYQDTVEELTDALNTLEGLPDPTRPAPGGSDSAPNETQTNQGNQTNQSNPTTTTTTTPAGGAPRTFPADSVLHNRMNEALVAFYAGEKPAESLSTALRVAGFTVVNPDGTVKLAPIGPENGYIVTEGEIQDFAALDQTNTTIPFSVFATPINRLLYGGSGTPIANPITNAFGKWITAARTSNNQSDRLLHTLVTNLALESERPLDPFLPTANLRIRPAIYLILSSVARKVVDTAPKAPSGLLASLQPAPRPQPASGGLQPLEPVTVPLSGSVIRATKSLAKMIRASTKLNVLSYFEDKGRLVRTTNRTPGERKDYAVAVLLMYKDNLGLISEMAGVINDAPVTIERGDQMPINPSVPSAIDAPGVDVELTVPDNPVFSVQTNTAKTSRTGIARLPLVGKPQEKDLNPQKVFRINKDQEATVKVKATWEQLKNALIFRFADPRINAELDAAMAGVTWEISQDVTIPVTDVADAAARLDASFTLNGSFTRNTNGSTFTRISRRTFNFVDCETTFFQWEPERLDEATLRSFPAAARAEYERNFEEAKKEPVRFIVTDGLYTYNIFDHTYRFADIGDCESELEEFNLTKTGRGGDRVVGDPLGNIMVEVDKQTKRVTVTLRCAYRFSSSGTRKRWGRGRTETTDLGNANGTENNDLWGIPNPEDEGGAKFVMPYTVIDTPKERILVANSIRNRLEQPLRGKATFKLILTYPKPPSE